MELLIAPDTAYIPDGCDNDLAIDMDIRIEGQPAVDKEGWEYAFDFKNFSKTKPNR
jgi:hypothetical protein